MGCSLDVYRAYVRSASSANDDSLIGVMEKPVVGDAEGRQYELAVAKGEDDKTQSAAAQLYASLGVGEDGRSTGPTCPSFGVSSGWARIRRRSRFERDGDRPDRNPAGGRPAHGARTRAPARQHESAGRTGPRRGRESGCRPVGSAGVGHLESAGGCLRRRGGEGTLRPNQRDGGGLGERAGGQRVRFR